MGRFIDRDIVREIKRKTAEIENKDRCIIRSLLHSLHTKSIEREATLHSYKIEHPAGATTSYDTHASARIVKKNKGSISEAFVWAKDNYDPAKLDEEFIKNLAFRIEPYNKGTYRNIGVRVSNATWTPPYEAKVPIEMGKYVAGLRETLSQENICSALQAAAYAHLHLVRIHPFEDGNGRTARALQNVILISAGLPPPVIYAGERFNYYQHLDKAIHGWRNRTGSDKPDETNDDENSYYNYIAGKVSVSLDRLLRW